MSSRDPQARHGKKTSTTTNTTNVTEKSTSRRKKGDGSSRRKKRKRKAEKMALKEENVVVSVRDGDSEGERENDEDASTKKKKTRQDGEISIPYFSLSTHGVSPTLYKTGLFLEAVTLERELEDEVLPQPEYLMKAMELFRFLSIKAVHGSEVSPGIDLDRVWHKVILQTSLYCDLCESVLSQWSGEDEREVRERNSRGVIEHSYLSSLDGARKKDERYKHTLFLYSQLYGHSTSNKLWPMNRDGARCLPPALRSISLPLSSRSHEGLLTVQIRTLIGKTFSIATHRDETIGELKIRVEETDNTPRTDQHLIHNRRKMEDERTLGEYEIGEMDMIHLILRLSGC